MGSQLKLNTELWELKQQLCSSCQDPEGVRRKPQNKFVAPSLRHSSAPRLSPPPVPKTTTKNVRGSDSSWLASKGQLASRHNDNDCNGEDADDAHADNDNDCNDEKRRQ